MRLVVTGGRFWNRQSETYAFLDQIDLEEGVSLLIHGGAKGADSLCAKWAETRGINTLRFDPDWDTQGRSAGKNRNQDMIDSGHPDGIAIFPGESGTKDMTRRAKAAGLKTWKWTTK